MLVYKYIKMPRNESGRELFGEGGNDFYNFFVRNDLHVGGDIQIDGNFSIGTLNIMGLESDSLVISTTAVLNELAVSTSATIGTTLGVGTLTPDVKLHVKETTNTQTSVKVENTSNGNLALASFIAESDGARVTMGAVGTAVTSTGAVQSDACVLLSENDSAGLSIVSEEQDIRFYAGGALEADEMLVIKSSGYVGIGVTAPTAPLHIASSFNNPILLIEGTESTNAFMLFQNTDTGTDSGAGVRFGLDNSEDFLLNHREPNDIIISTDNIERLRIDSVGNVGINNSSPAFELDVDGDVNFTGTLFQDGVTFSGSNWTVSGNDIYNSNSGFIGIGVTNPQAPLHISTTDNNPAMIIENSDTTNALLRFFNSDTGSTSTDGFVMGLNNSEDFIMNHTEVKDIIFFTDSTERLRINSVGNVGINNSLPAYELDVTGDINFTGTLFQDGVTFTSGGGSSNWTESGNNLFNNNTGNVGIGITDGVELLHLNIDNSGAVGILVTNSSTGPTSTDGLFIGLDASENIIFNNQHSADMKFQANGSDRMVLLGNGFTGFGTGSPDNQFHVAANSNSHRYMTMSNTNSGTSSRTGFQSKSNAGELEMFSYSSGFSTSGFAQQDSGSVVATSTMSNGLSIGALSATGDVRFYAGGSTDSELRMIIEAGGDVGIGIDNPVEKLHVLEAQNASTKIEVENTTSGTAATGELKASSNAASTSILSLSSTYTTSGPHKADGGLIASDSNSSGGLAIASLHATANLSFWQGGTADLDEKIRINETLFRFFSDETAAGTKGYVFKKRATAGTNNVFLEFQRSATDIDLGTVEGDLRLDGSGNLVLQDTSDSRLKTNVQELTTGYDICKNLRSVSFDWIDETRPNDVIGYIAQEVQQHLPKSVDDTKEYMTMNRNDLIPVMWSAIRKLIDKVEALES